LDLGIICGIRQLKIKIIGYGGLVTLVKKQTRERKRLVDKALAHYQSVCQRFIVGD